MAYRPALAVGSAAQLADFGPAVCR